MFRPDLPPGERLGHSNLLNDSVLAACKQHDDALRPMAYPPAEDPEAATTIAEKLDARWAGVVNGAELSGRSYADSDYHPLWRALQRGDLPIFIHPGSTPDARLDPFYLSNLLGNLVETTVVAAQLIFGGVLHDFPELKFILAHGGGALAALVGRWQKGVATKRSGVSELPPPPPDAARRFHVASLVHSAAYGEMPLRMFGAEHILLGSDWPFPMGADDPDADLGAFAPEVVEQIRNLNANRVFGARLSWPRES